MSGVSSSGFANANDGREKGEWESRYSKKAWKHIVYESLYLGAIFIGDITLFVLISTDNLGSFSNEPVLRKYGLAWLGGTFGGVLFSLKWLYHSVAKNIWHVDRRLWRLFTPHLSGGLSFVMIMIISSGIINVFDKDSLDSRFTTYALGFLIGYFSDAAIGKLSEVATTFFGVSGKRDDKS